MPAGSLELGAHLTSDTFEERGWVNEKNSAEREKLILDLCESNFTMTPESEISQGTFLTQQKCNSLVR